MKTQLSRVGKNSSRNSKSSASVDLLLVERYVSNIISILLIYNSIVNFQLLSIARNLPLNLLQNPGTDS